MFWDQEVLSAPHTQRDLDSIPQRTPEVKELHALRVKLDRAQSEVERLKEDPAEARQREEDAVSQHDTLRDQRDAEKALTVRRDTILQVVKRALEDAAQTAYDTDAKAFRARYVVDYKGRQRWDRLQLRSAENHCMNIISEDAAAAIRAIPPEDIMKKEGL